MCGQRNYIFKRDDGLFFAGVVSGNILWSNKLNAKRLDKKSRNETKKFLKANGFKRFEVIDVIETMD